ncbi:class I SAM-dependent methyltransferase [Archangium minus]|uniref:Class I SAM-dependent methyltransferase n=2 Tax=Archangiaceae TaxID=39 RepID=A0ABY9X9V4_9BACT|nr:class I SAM-dependent methyltransferase [Archangium violaceum]WNG52181.1 class I SAM-dependent methyltransferase [Archangium minus]
MVPVGWLGLDRARHRLVEGLSGRVLEVGTGTGLLSYPPSVSSVVAIDIDPELLDRASHRRPGVTLMRADVQQLPFPNGSFDAVVACLVFCTVEDPARGLAEIRRVLRPGGQLRLLEHVRSPHPTVARLQDRLTPVWSRLAMGCQLNRDTVPLVEASGFRITHRAQRLRELVEELVAVPV